MKTMNILDFFKTEDDGNSFVSASSETLVRTTPKHDNGKIKRYKNPNHIMEQFRNIVNKSETGITITIDYKKLIKADEPITDIHITNKLRTLLMDYTVNKKGQSTGFEYVLIPELSQSEMLHWHGVIKSPSRNHFQRFIKECRDKIGRTTADKLRNTN